jgi:hypothetical protein
MPRRISHRRTLTKTHIDATVGAKAKANAKAKAGAKAF